MNAKIKSALIIVSTIIGLIGCSTTRTVRMDSEQGNWTVGQQNYCVYKADILLCTPQGRVQMSYSTPADKKQLVPETLEGITDFQQTIQAGDDTVHLNVFDAKFSQHPDDYSIWNCLITGIGVPAIQCKLMRHPNADDKKAAARAEEDSALRALRYLDASDLRDRCGSPSTDVTHSYQFGFRPEQTAESGVLFYEGNSMLLAFVFGDNAGRYGGLEAASALPHGASSDINSSDANRNYEAYGLARRGSHLWSVKDGQFDESDWYVKEMPCLFKGWKSRRSLLWHP